MNSLGTQPEADSPGLSAAVVIQVALGGAIADPEIFRVAITRGQGMPDHEDIASILTLRSAAAIRGQDACCRYQHPCHD